MKYMRARIRILGHPVSLGTLLLLLGSCALLVPIWLKDVNTRELMHLNYGDIVSICVFVATVVIAVFSIIPNLSSMAKTARSAHYSELDGMYLHLLTLAVDKPFLRQPDQMTATQMAAYEPYAFMVWNFLETIHDRCADDPQLRGTWAPIIAAEHELHRRWFERETVPYSEKVAPKFCLQFCDFIWRSFWVPGKTSLGAAHDWSDANWHYRDEAEIHRDPAVSAWVRGVASQASVPAFAAPTC